MKNENNSLLFSILLSQNQYYNHEITMEDLTYTYVNNVTDCQIKLYRYVIECISKGMTYEEITASLDKIDMEEYQRLSSDEQEYLQRKLRRDITSRKNNEIK